MEHCQGFITYVAGVKKFIKMKSKMRMQKKIFVFFSVVTLSALSVSIISHTQDLGIVMHLRAFQEIISSLCF